MRISALTVWVSARQSRRSRRVTTSSAGVGAAIAASPLALPAAVAEGYLITAGAVAAAVSQLIRQSEP